MARLSTEAVLPANLSGFPIALNSVDDAMTGRPKSGRVLRVICWTTIGFSSAVAAAKSDLVPVTPASPVVRAIGYEVAPPQGMHWFSYRTNEPGWVTFRKQDPSRASLPGAELVSFVVEIKAERYGGHDLNTPAGLEAALKFALYEKPDEFKYSPARLEHYPWQGTNCIRYAMTRDRPATVKGESIPFRWQVEGFFCRHPYIPHVAVTGLLQERRPTETPSLLDGALRQEAEGILDSVRFSPMD